MINHYIKKEETIILNVLQCGDDAQTCESMKLSLEIDKEWNRTLLVYTKIDKEDISSILSKYNNLVESYSVPKDHVFFVKNRSPKDISEKLSLQDAQEEEQLYFMKHKKKHWSQFQNIVWDQIILQRDYMKN